MKKGLMMMSLLSAKSAVGEAHSKLILVGEHAVVYGKPAIAIPFPLKITVVVEEKQGDAEVESFVYSGNVKEMPYEMNGIMECIKKTFNLLRKPLRDIKIRIDSDIPLGRGLGSSAAAATAVVRGIFSFFNRKLSHEELFYLVGLSETYAHGKPSGIDMTAVASDMPIYFKNPEGGQVFKAIKPFHIVVADSGLIGDTRKAVENVRSLYNNDKEKISNIIDKIGAIVDRIKICMMNGDIQAIGRLFDENHELLRGLGVSNNSIDSLVNEARSLGALGAKLTGGGLGGCIFALAESLDVAKKISKGLIAAGAVKSWCFSTKENEIIDSLGFKGGYKDEGNGKSKYQYCFD
ncbi:mevalonate kinase [Alloiococcus sp. CFN-8]|uniref:mevalonate kinase n=1 Tax=Alloiococcus sp. CFN-8 TaxID=3416081 RepID=UPI003CE8FDB9